MAIMLLSHKYCSKVENEFMLTLMLKFCPKQKLLKTNGYIECDCLTENVITYNQAAILDITAIKLSKGIKKAV